MVAKSGFDVARRMQAVGEAAIKAQRISVQRAAAAMKDAHLTGLDRDAPGRRLRNAGRKGAKLNVGYTIKGGTSNPSAIVEARGPWQLLNNPAKPHEIGPKRGHKAIRFGNTFRASVHHPGHRGKRTWQRAEPAAAKAGAKELNRTMVNVVQQAFKG